VFSWRNYTTPPKQLQQIELIQYCYTRKKIQDFGSAPA